MALAFSIPVDQFEKSTVFATGLLFLIKKCQLVPVEFVEPFVPTDFFQSLAPRTARKIDAQYAGVVVTAGPSDHNGFTIMRFHPLSDFLVVECSFAGHGSAP